MYQIWSKELEHEGIGGLYNGFPLFFFTSVSTFISDKSAKFLLVKIHNALNKK